MWLGYDVNLKNVLFLRDPCSSCRGDVLYCLQLSNVFAKNIYLSYIFIPYLSKDRQNLIETDVDRTDKNDSIVDKHVKIALINICHMLKSRGKYEHKERNDIKYLNKTSGDDK